VEDGFLKVLDADLTAINKMRKEGGVTRGKANG